jgi:hypothetical protein
MDTVKIIHDTLTVGIFPNKINFDTLSVLFQSTPNNSIAWISIISALTAMLAVFVGPIIQLYISKKQTANQLKLTEMAFSNQYKMKEAEIKKNLLSTKRTEWIDKLRLLFSGLSSKIVILSLIMPDKNIDKKTLYKLIEDLDMLVSQIELSLNPLEENHVKMKNILVKLQQIAVEEDLFKKEYAIIQKEFIKIAGKILKEEWEKAKRLE